MSFEREATSGAVDETEAGGRGGSEGGREGGCVWMRRRKKRMNDLLIDCVESCFWVGLAGKAMGSGL